MKVSRDSVLWTLNMIGALAVLIAANTPLFPGMPDGVSHVISIIAAAYGMFSGKMATSPLPGKHDL